MTHTYCYQTNLPFSFRDLRVYKLESFLISYHNTVTNITFVIVKVLSNGYHRDEWKFVSLILVCHAISGRTFDVVVDIKTVSSNLML